MLKMMTITGSRRMKIVSVGFVRFEMTLETLLKVNKWTDIFNRDWTVHSKQIYSILDTEDNIFNRHGFQFDVNFTFGFEEESECLAKCNTNND